MATITRPGTSLFRNALLLESAFNISGGIGMILLPTLSLRYMIPSNVIITPLAIQLVQWLGGIVLALTTPLLLSYSETVSGIGSRKTAYWTLASGEMGLLGVMALQILKPETIQAQNVLTERAMAATWAVLGSTLGWRLYALLVKPEIMGSVGEVKGKKGQ